MLNCAAIYIPSELTAYFSNPDNKILHDVYQRIKNDAQSNIFFHSTKPDDHCSSNSEKRLYEFPSSSITFGFIQSQLCLSLYPLLLDFKLIEYHILECDQECSHSGCKTENVIVSLQLHEMDNAQLLAIANSIFINDIDVSLADNLQKLASFFCILFNKPDQLAKFNSYIMSSEFINDIKSVPKELLLNIISSFVRAILFPSSQTSQQQEFSIDWHNDNPSRVSGFSIFRIDVQSINRTGNGTSGTNRIIIAIKDKKKVLLGFTQNHDLTETVIRNRLRHV
jgi:hypothetical protein